MTTLIKATEKFKRLDVRFEEYGLSRSKIDARSNEIDNRKLFLRNL